MSFHLSNEVVKSIKNQSFVPKYIEVQKQLANFTVSTKTSSVSKKITNYKDTILSDMAKEINAIQEETNRQIHTLVEENRKASRTSFWLAVSSIALSAATLIVSFLSLLIQLYS